MVIGKKPNFEAVYLSRGDEYGMIQRYITPYLAYSGIERRQFRYSIYVYRDTEEWYSTCMFSHAEYYSASLKNP
jgi:hypothetical protein